MLRYVFLTRRTRVILADNRRHPYENSVAAFKQDALGGIPWDRHMAKQDMKENSTKNKGSKASSFSSGVGSGEVMSDILKGADRRAMGTKISPQREQLLDMMRLLHRRQQKIFEDISPHRRETLRMIAEHMLHVDTDKRH